MINCMTTRGNEAILSLKSSDGTRTPARENRLSAGLVPWYVCQEYPMMGGLALEMHAPSARCVFRWDGSRACDERGRVSDNPTGNTRGLSACENVHVPSAAERGGTERSPARSQMVRLLSSRLLTVSHVRPLASADRARSCPRRRPIHSVLPFLLAAMTSL